MNDRSSIQAAVLRILGEVLRESAEQLRAQPVLAAHAWDSLASLEALAALESELGITLDLRDYTQVREIHDLVDLVAAAAAQTTPQR